MPKKYKKYYDKAKEDNEPLNEENHMNIKQFPENFGIKEIFFRFFHSLIPIDSKLKISLLNSPDLVGPIFISTLIIILTFYLFKNFNLFTNNGKANSIIIFSYISFIIYFYIFGFTFLIYICLMILGKKLNYKYLISIFGYSLSIFIPILLLHLIFGKLSFVYLEISFGFGIYSTILFLFFNFSNIDVSTAVKYLLCSFSNFIIVILISCISCQLFSVLNNSQSSNLSLKNNQSNILNINNNIINGITNNMIEKTINITNNKKLIINIALSADYKYTYPTLVFITSLMENIGPNSFYQIYLMTPDDDKKNNLTNTLDTLITKYGNDKLNITYLLIDSSKIPKNVSVNEHITKETYFRLILPSLLPNLDRILYMDTDIINLKDLTELYTLDLEEDIYLRCVPTRKKFLKQLEEFDIYTNYYFNAGVLLMNLKSFRKFGIEKKLIDLISTHKLEMHDQTALNIICYKNKKLMHPKFNLGAFTASSKFSNYKKALKDLYTDKEIKEAYYHPVNLHYSSVAGGKPWNKKYVPLKQYWWYYANKTDFMSEIMNYSNYDQRLVNYFFKVFKKYHKFIHNYKQVKNKKNITI